jgi:hypothetical protein
MAMPKSLSTLEKNILKAKGLSAAQITKLGKAGITSKADFQTIGDAATLRQLVGLSEELAAEVMAWAVGVTAGGGKITVDSADIVYCVHCKTRQPKDYKSGDLCPACGKQAEPVLTCVWCGSSSPGKFCRQCGAQNVPSSELELAIQLRRDGLAKDDIPKRLAGMSAADKEALWAKARRGR